MLPSPASPEVPADTAAAVWHAFPKGHPYLTLRDTFGPLYSDATFAALFAPDGRPAESPANLALVTALQFREGLSDRQAADAVRSSLLWKYLLGLPLTDPGFDASVLCRFRARLQAGQAAQQLLDGFLGLLRTHHLLTAPQRAPYRAAAEMLLYW